MQESNDGSALDFEHSKIGGHSPEPQLVINESKEQSLSSDVETVLKLSGAYCRVMILCLSIGLTLSGYFAISALLTSFNQELGYFTAILLWIPYIIAQLFLSPTMVKILKPKYSVVAAFSCYTFFYITNIYPSWYTLPIGAIVYAMGSGCFLWTGSLSYLTQLAHSVSKATGAPASHYIGNFQGLFYFFLALSSVIGNGLSLVFLLPDQLLIDSESADSSNLSSNISISNNTPEQCDLDVQVAAVSPWAYYGLTSVFVVLGLVSVVLVIFIPPRPKICKKQSICKNRINCSTLQCHVDRKQVCHGMRKLVINPLKRLLKPTFLAIGGLSFFSGYETAFFSGTFTKHFVSECLGVGLIGPVVIVYGIATSVLRFLTGRMSAYTSRTAISLFSGICQFVFIVFLLVWERRPSYYMVFASAAIQGSISGMLFPLPTICMGVVSQREERETAFSIVRGTFGIGGTVNLIISIFVPVNINLGIMLIVLVLAVILYVVTERLMGSDPAAVTKLLSAMCGRTGHYNTGEQRKQPGSFPHI